MLKNRKTAIIKFSYGHEESSDSDLLALDSARQYDTTLLIEGVSYPSRRFLSPIGDELWRDTIVAIRLCAEERERSNRRLADSVADTGNKLYCRLAELSPALKDFLQQSDPRRLVIASDRPEIQALPWEAMTNDQLDSPARSDLSLVRCGYSVFPSNSSPARGPSLLRILPVTGPDTENRTLEPLRRVADSQKLLKERGIEILQKESQDIQADVIHIEAHGNRDSAAITTAQGEELDPRQLADRYQKRDMVLLWSCYSGMMHSWGESPAMQLHRKENVMVLGFVAPLNFDSAQEIARDFYERVFGARGSQDPEQAVTEIRAWLFEQRKEFCDWVSLTLWLRQPLDLNELPLGRIRLPEVDWSDNGKQIPEVVRKTFEKNVALGDVRLIQGVSLGMPIPKSLVEGWGGTVIHLEGTKALTSDQIFNNLGIPLNSCHHPADRFLALLEELKSFRYALLLWTGITAREALLVQTLERIPHNLGMVLMSPFTFQEQWAGRIVSESANGGSKEPILKDIPGFIQLVSRDEFQGALDLLPDPQTSGDPEYWHCRYLACIKTGQQDKAEAAVQHLEQIDKIEAAVLWGNLISRQGRHKEARESYERALDYARGSDSAQHIARAQQELAYVAAEMGDRGLAEEKYRSAIKLLENTAESDRDSRWTSALGRALRDFADLLAEDGDQEALPLLRRATAIHALQGRITQVAYCFVTRSKLMLKLDRHEEAEDFAQKAAIAFAEWNNLDGWTDAICLIAKAAAARYRYDQPLAVLEKALAKLQKPSLRGRILLQSAEVLWNAGRLCEARGQAQLASKLLPKDCRRERARTQSLERLLDTLL
jgi:tetratricopeptide (TPR) repeat protein